MWQGLDCWDSTKTRHASGPAIEPECMVNSYLEERLIPRLCAVRDGNDTGVSQTPKRSLGSGKSCPVGEDMTWVLCLHSVGLYSTTEAMTAVLQSEHCRLIDATSGSAACGALQVIANGPCERQWLRWHVE
jgi:hypothetical protein